MDNIIVMCGECGKEIHELDIICPHCHKVIGSNKISSIKNFPSTCQKCGILIEIGKKYCDKCSEEDHTYNMLRCSACQKRTKHVVYAEHCMCTICKNLSTTSGMEDTVATVKLQLLKAASTDLVEELEKVGTMVDLGPIKSLLSQI
jgi:hypothetical protein